MGVSLFRSVSDTVIEQCRRLIDAVPPRCASAEKGGEFEKCIIDYFGPADNCIKQYQQCDPDRSTGILTYFQPYHETISNIIKASPNQADSLILQAALQDVYYSSIGSCKPELIGRAAASINKLAIDGKLGEAADYIRNTNENNFEDSLQGRRFSKKDGTVLLVFLFMREGKSAAESLKEALKYIPLKSSQLQ